MNNQLSKCHRAPTTIGGDDTDPLGGTHYYYYVCSQCGEPCDLYVATPSSANTPQIFMTNDLPSLIEASDALGDTAAGGDELPSVFKGEVSRQEVMTKDGVEWVAYPKAELAHYLQAQRQADRKLLDHYYGREMLELIAKAVQPEMYDGHRCISGAELIQAITHRFLADEGEKQ